MNKRILSQLVACLCLALLAHGAQRKAIEITDKNRNMVLSGFTSWKLVKLDEHRARFVAKGSLHGIWKDQGLDVLCKTMEGIFDRQTAGTNRLTTAEMSGGVVATMTKQEPKTSRATVVRCERMIYDGDQSEAKIVGSTIITSTLANGSETFTMHGSGANLKLAPLGERAEMPVRSGHVAGPVTMHLESMQLDSKGKSRKVVIDGKGRVLTFDDVARIIVLSGDVELNGNDESIVGHVTATKATIRLNEKREVAEVEFEGEPGETSYREGKGGH